MYRMSLLAQVNQPNKDGYYFALDSTPGDAIVTAGSFLANGVGTGGVGSFVSRADGVPGGTPVFNMLTSAGVAQWGIGMQGTSGPGNAGNDLNIWAYDNNGNYLSSPLTLDRSSGGVSINTSLGVTTDAAIGQSLNVGTAANVTGALTAGSVAATGGVAGTNVIGSASVTAGVPTTVGGGIVQANGTLGASRVYDPIYNNPVMGSDTLLMAQGADGTIVSNVPFVCPATGTYVLSALLVAYGGAPFSWNNNTNSLMYGMTYNGGANIVAGGQIYISGIVDPTGRPAIGPLAANTTEYQIDIIVNLTASVTYQIAYGATGAAFNLGPGGTVGISVAPLLT